MIRHRIAEGGDARAVMGDYYPTAAYCDKTTIETGGVEACLRG
jgi:hypothetical protein